MLKKVFNYVDYDGNQVSETCYFALSKAEIINFQVRGNGTFIDNLKSLLENRDIEKLYDFFKELVLDSYGVKSEDGRRFKKTPEIREDFKYSIPYSELITELMTNEDKIAEFARGVTPFDLSEEDIKKAMKSAKESLDAHAPDSSSGT